MKELFHQLFEAWGLDLSWQPALAWVAALVSIVVLSYILGWLIQGGISGFIRSVAKRTQNQWDDYLFDRMFFRRLGMVVPAIVSYLLFVSLVTPDATIFPLVKKLIMLLVVFSATAFVDRLITNTQNGFLAILGDKKIPVRSYVQVAKIVLFLVSGILVFSIILDQNPMGILTGLGAMTAVLLLVFKDSLLGFVASLQLNSNNLVQIGDWIEIPGQNIDGEVIDIALSIVKIRSGDNTIYSLPTYNLVSGTFKNWRNMKEMGARRLKLSFPIDCLNLEVLTKTKEKSLKASGHWKVPENLVEVSNAEAFRFWAQDYLDNLGEIHPGQPRVVKFGAPVGRGLPLEMVFYTSVTGYPDFEHLHSRLLCHYLATLPVFGLRVFQEPVGVLKG